jgi:hypothetical protein
MKSRISVTSFGWESFGARPAGVAVVAAPLEAGLDDVGLDVDELEPHAANASASRAPVTDASQRTRRR